MNRNFRHTIYRVVTNRDETALGKCYTYFMFVVILLSLVPLAFRRDDDVLRIIDVGSSVVFIADYLLRWMTADLSRGGGRLSFLKYPFTPMAIVDLLSILPTFTAMHNAFGLFRTTRLVRIVRMFKIVRYSKEISLFMDVIVKQRAVLLSVFFVAVSYILFTALIMFNVDEQFGNFFEALYWSTTALTTVGYGDICPHNDIGRIISMISSLMGVAIIALPSGVITASYLKAIEDLKVSKKKKELGQNANGQTE